jgi:hypothetical protein
VLAVVHDLADGRVGVGRNLDKVEIGVPGGTKRSRELDDASLLAVGEDKSDTRNFDLRVDALIADAGASCGRWLYRC